MSKSILPVVYFPSKLISSCMGIGYLPVWGNHWSSFLSLIVVVLILYVQNLYEASLASMCHLLIIVAMIGYVISIVTSHILLAKDSEIRDELVLNIFLAQILVFALSAPGILYTATYFVAIFKNICTKFVYCAPWLYNTLIFMPVFIVPFVAFIITDIVKPWPASYLDKSYKNAFSKAAESLICAFYASFAVYFFAFVFGNLTLVQCIEFFDHLARRTLSMNPQNQSLFGIGNMDPVAFIRSV